MNGYEILPFDFDGSSNKMDHLIRWVKFESVEEAKEYAANNNLDPDSVGLLDKSFADTITVWDN